MMTHLIDFIDVETYGERPLLYDELQPHQKKFWPELRSFEPAPPPPPDSKPPEGPRIELTIPSP